MSDGYKMTDDEELICRECNFQSDDYHYYRCGPEYGWIGYSSTIAEEEER